MAFELSDKDYLRLRALVYAKSGINLHEGKKNLLRARLGKRLRATGSKNFEEYYDYLTLKDNGTELVQMLDAITTNQTSFFRERRQFDFLEEELFPRMEEEGGKKVKIRFWSAGCSTGEEPYSIGIAILEYFRTRVKLDAKILATDISTRVLDSARKGVFSGDRIREMPVTMQRRYFQKGFGKQEGYYKVKGHLRRLVVFRNLNLMEKFQFANPFHAVFCRNVMIYFDKRTQQNLIHRLQDCLVPGGYLFVGHSESLSGVSHGFQYVLPSVYQKKPELD